MIHSPGHPPIQAQSYRNDAGGKRAGNSGSGATGRDGRQFDFACPYLLANRACLDAVVSATCLIARELDAPAGVRGCVACLSKDLNIEENTIF